MTMSCGANPWTVADKSEESWTGASATSRNAKRDVHNKILTRFATDPEAVGSTSGGQHRAGAARRYRCKRSMR